MKGWRQRFPRSTVTVPALVAVVALLATPQLVHGAEENPCPRVMRAVWIFRGQERPRVIGSCTAQRAGVYDADTCERFDSLAQAGRALCSLADAESDTELGAIMVSQFYPKELAEYVREIIRVSAAILEKDYRQAHARVLRAMSLKPSQSDALVLLARIEYARGNFSRALDLVDRAIGQNQFVMTTTANIAFDARAHIHAAQGNLPGAEDDLRRVLGSGDSGLITFYAESARSLRFIDASESPTLAHYSRALAAGYRLNPMF